jgi:hypothetical protein
MKRLVVRQSVSQLESLLDGLAHYIENNEFGEVDQGGLLEDDADYLYYNANNNSTNNSSTSKSNADNANNVNINNANRGHINANGSPMKSMTLKRQLPF